MEKVGAIIVGAGVIGLSLAVKLASAGIEVVVLEQAARAGTGISARNSGVIHAGIYYPEGSLKSRLCAKGNALLYAFCREYAVPFRRIGKWVVATRPEETPALRAIEAHAKKAGVTSLSFHDGAAVRAAEPAVQAVAGLWSPTTGILDVAAYISALEARFSDLGGVLVSHTAVTAVGQAGAGDLWVEAGGMRLGATIVVNAAGLGAQAVARATEGLASRFIPELHLSKGSYFSYRGRSPFRHLIYPVPEPGGLGVHATIDLAGDLRFGPDVEAVSEPDYRVDQSKSEIFAGQILRYYPGLDRQRLSPDFAGIRPRLAPSNDLSDFAVSGPTAHGVEGLYNLFGCDSPGLTSSLALAEWLASAMILPK
ncbi:MULTISPECIES: NAD(P)/FAD-dependent oxidoreductase [Kordiimonas]|uniref:NAD(P)/FAD-dependent oxidoreductase n=1 Tax=Kordiimonas TaxID=288021 RepID=UPI00257E8696|nr:NAD(P)/FAD-dependent oxidoreductase [Kordiimonas sp. UBA4487]